MNIALFLFLIFYDVLELHIPMMNYWDELAAGLVFCWGVCSFRKRPRMERGDLVNWICLCVLVAIGAISNVVYPGLQPQLVAVVKDVVALCKFPVIFLILQRREISREKQAENLALYAKISRWILLLTPAALAVGWFVDLGFYTDDIRILPSCTFLYSNPTFFISSYVMIAAVLMAESIDKNRPFLLLNCLILFMAQRSKGYIFIAFVLLFVILGEKWVSKILTLFLGSDREKVKTGRLFLAMTVFGLAVFIMGKPRLDRFLVYGMAGVRVALYVVGARILVDFFPLGSGLGTFASYISGEYYSKLYAMYGIDNVWGMSEDFYPFISDVFWPYIYGQFGIFGLLLYLKLVISIFFRQFRSGISEGSRIAVTAVWIYALIATTSEAYFTNGTGVQMALFLSLIIGYGQRKEIG